MVEFGQGRRGGLFGGIIVGGLIFLAAFPLLFWNEGRAVRRAQALDEGAGAVISVAVEQPDPANEAKLVHTAGTAATNETLTDAEFGISAQALRLRRIVEMYQWDEDEKSRKRGKTRTTEYVYEKVWSDTLIDSSDFHESGHSNPATMPVTGQLWTAKKVTMGGFTLGPDQVGRIRSWNPIPITEEIYQALPEEHRSGAVLNGGGLYRGKDAANPVIGDIRIRFARIDPTRISVVAQQAESTFRPFQTSVDGETISLLQEGDVSAEEMFADAHRSNTIMTWILRGAGFFMMFIGLASIFSPLTRLTGFIPLIGEVVGFAVMMVSAGIAAACSLATVSFAWLFYRPLLGGGLLVGAVVCLTLALRMGKPKSAKIA